MEDGVEKVYERKKNKYSDLAAEASQNDWKTSNHIHHQPAWKNQGEGALSTTGHQVHVGCNWLWIKREDGMWSSLGPAQGEGHACHAEP